MAKLGLHLSAATALIVAGALISACGSGDKDDEEGTGGTTSGSGGTTSSGGGLGTGGLTSGTGGLTGATGGTTGAPTCDAATQNLVDDLEAGDEGGAIVAPPGYWYLDNDGAAGGVQTPDTAAGTAGVGNPGAGFASTSEGFGDVLDPDAYGSAFGISFDACLDASAYDGVKFDIKGSGPIDVTLSMAQLVPVSDGGTCTGEGCWDTHQMTLTLTDTWTTVEIYWDGSEAFPLFQNGGWKHSNKYDFDPAQLLQIAWKAPSGTYDAVVDNVEWIGDGGGMGGAGNN